MSKKNNNPSCSQFHSANNQNGKLFETVRIHRIDFCRLVTHFGLNHYVFPNCRHFEILGKFNSIENPTGLLSYGAVKNHFRLY